LQNSFQISKSFFQSSPSSFSVPRRSNFQIVIILPPKINIFNQKSGYNFKYIVNFIPENRFYFCIITLFWGYIQGFEGPV